MKALILDGKVVDIVENEFEVHSSFTWVDATADTERNGTWDGTNFGPADTRTAEQKAADDLASLRAERDHRLLQTDYYALSDVTMSAEMTTYRQALRDITDTYTSMNDEGFAWPTKPE
jgi:hypothetical protein